MNLNEFLEFLSKGGALAVMTLLLWSIIKGILVPGRELRLLAERVRKLEAMVEEERHVRNELRMELQVAAAQVSHFRTLAERCPCLDENNPRPSPAT